MKYTVTVQLVPAKSIDKYANETNKRSYCFIEKIPDEEATFFIDNVRNGHVCDYRPTMIDLINKYGLKPDVIQDLTDEVQFCYHVTADESGELMTSKLYEGSAASNSAWSWPTKEGDLYTFSDRNEAIMSHSKMIETLVQERHRRMNEINKAPATSTHAVKPPKSKCNTYRLMEALAKIANQSGEGVQITGIEFEDGSGHNFNVTFDGVTNRFISLKEGNNHNKK